MPFASPRSNGTIDAWAVNPSGDYQADCETGNGYFAQLKDHIDRFNTPMLMTFVIQAIVLKGALTGIEVGFISALNDTLSAA